MELKHCFPLFVAFHVCVYPSYTVEYRKRNDVKPPKENQRERERVWNRLIIIVIIIMVDIDVLVAKNKIAPHKKTKKKNWSGPPERQGSRGKDFLILQHTAATRWRRHWSGDRPTCGTETHTRIHTQKKKMQNLLEDRRYIKNSRVAAIRYSIYKPPFICCLFVCSIVFEKVAITQQRSPSSIVMVW